MAKGAWFDFTETGGDPAIFVAGLTDPDAIANARAILAGEPVSAPTIMGVLEGRPADYNVGWAFHLTPESVGFYEVAAEGMQSNVLGVAHNLDYWLHAWNGAWATYLTPIRELEASFGRNTDDRLDGTGGADLLVGRGGSDLLRGGEGHDVLGGGNGRDTLKGGDGDDRLGGGAARDDLVGGAGDDQLFGDAGRDALDGGEGDDRLTSALDGDNLNGGAGADVFAAAIGVAPDGGGVRIFDFKAREGDLLDVSEVDADILTDGDQAFTVVDAFTGHAGEAVILHAWGSTRLLLDVDGDSHTDYDIYLDRELLEASDLVL